MTAAMFVHMNGPSLARSVREFDRIELDALDFGAMFSEARPVSSPTMTGAFGRAAGRSMGRGGSYGTGAADQQVGLGEDHQRKESKERAASSTSPTSRAGAETESARDGLRRPDSGKVRTIDSAQSVDGRENGVPPGASTEAPVNALNSNQDQGSTDEGSAHDPELAAEASKGTEVLTVQLAQALKQANDPNAELTMAQDVQGQGDLEAQIKARLLAHQPAMAIDQSLLGDRQAVFSTGLAEQMIRLLTNAFDEVKAQDTSSNAGKMTPNAIGGLAESGPKSGNSSLGPQVDLTFTRALGNRPAGPGGNIARIVNVIRSNIGLRYSQLTIQLDPPELGRLKIDIKLAGNQVQVNITTETHPAQQMITERFALLRAALESQGITITKFDVQHREFPHDQQQGQYQSNGQGTASSWNRSGGRSKEQSPNRSFGRFGLDTASASTVTEAAAVRVSAAEQSEINLVA